jgi:hypothetical protein
VLVHVARDDVQASNQTQGESPRARNLCFGEGAEKAVVAEPPRAKKQGPGRKIPHASESNATDLSYELNWRQEHPENEHLPVILPLVMYHGEDGAWTAARRVEDLFALPGEAQEERERWRALVPRFEYLLDDLTAERAEALLARPGPPLVRLAWLLLRYGRSEQLARKLREWGPSSPRCWRSKRATSS